MSSYHHFFFNISQAASVEGGRREPSALPSAAVGREHPQKKEKEKEKESTHLHSSGTKKYGNEKENNSAVALATHAVAGAVAGAVAASLPHQAPASVGSSAFLGEKKKEKENEKKEKSPGGVRTHANAHASPLQVEAEKKEKKEKGLGLLRLQNLWDDDEAEEFFFLKKHLCFFILFFFAHTTLYMCPHTSFYSISCYSICVVIPDTTLRVLEEGHVHTVV
jgi:hypothetical protein